MSYYDLPAEMEARAKAVHDDAFIFDGAVSMMGFYIEEETAIQAFLDGGVTGANASLATSETDFAIAVDNISKFKRLIERNPDTLALVLSAADLVECKRAGQFGMAFISRTRRRSWTSSNTSIPSMTWASGFCS